MGRKLFCVDFDFWCELEKYLKRVKKGKNMGELHTSRGVINKGHPIRTCISRSKSSLGHFLTLVDNLKKCILILPFCYNCKGNCHIFTISARWWTLFFTFFSKRPGKGVKKCAEFYVCVKNPSLTVI